MSGRATQKRQAHSRERQGMLELCQAHPATLACRSHKAGVAACAAFDGRIFDASTGAVHVSSQSARPLLTLPITASLGWPERGAQA